MIKNVESDELYKIIDIYCKDKKAINLTPMTLSVTDLVTILQEYYQELYDLFDNSSEKYKNLLDEVNRILSPEYSSILKKKKSSLGMAKIKDTIKRGIFKISLSNKDNKVCKGIHLSIRSDVCAVMFDIVSNGEERPVIICRDIDACQVHLAKDSSNNEVLLEKMRSEIVSILDTVDSFRATLPIPNGDNTINKDSIINDNICLGQYFEVPFEDKMFEGSIRVFANGEVATSLEFKSEYGNIDIDDNLKNINQKEILEKIAIDVSSIRDPIKSIVLSSFDREYNVASGEYKRM